MAVKQIFYSSLLLRYDLDILGYFLSQCEANVSSASDADAASSLHFFIRLFFDGRAVSISLYGLSVHPAFITVVCYFVPGVFVLFGLRLPMYFYCFSAGEEIYNLRTR